MNDHKKTREKKIAELVAEGKTNVEIGEIVCLSAQAVANDLTNIFAEKGVRNRMELARQVWQGKKK